MSAILYGVAAAAAIASALAVLLLAVPLLRQIGDLRKAAERGRDDLRSAVEDLAMETRITAGGLEQIARNARGTAPDERTL